MTDTSVQWRSVLAVFGWICLGAGLASAAFLAPQSLQKSEEVAEESGDIFANAGPVQKRYQEFLERQEKNRYWANEIIKGGYIIHFRHAQRERWTDASAFDAYELYAGINPLEIETAQYRATCLTRRGIEEAKMMKKVLEIAGVKFSRVLSSPSCRAWMTAQYAFEQIYEIDNSLLNRTAIMPEQHAEFDQRLRNLLLNVEIKPGSNVAMTGHGATLRFAGDKVLDADESDQQKPRLETGFFVIERVDGRLIKRYRFSSIKDFANVVIRLPLE